MGKAALILTIGLALVIGKMLIGLNERTLSQTEMIESVEKIVGRLCKRDVFSGTVLVAKAEDVLFQHACGEASKRSTTFS